jgi:hypothetical protein
MAVPAVTLTILGRNATYGDLAGIPLKIVASTTPYLTAQGGLPFDLATVLNQANGSACPINPGDVEDILPALSTNLFLAMRLTLGRSVADGVTTLNSTTLSSATAAFTAADVGRAVQVDGAGAGGAPLGGQVSPAGNTTAVTIVSQTGTACVLSSPALTAGTALTILIGVPTYTVGSVIGAVTRVDATVRPQLTLATCPAFVHLYATGAGSAGALGEFADGNNSDTINCILLVARGGTNTN